MYSSSNTKPCSLLLLVGLKGAGKTFIGSVLEKYLDVKFLRVEPIFLEVMRLEPELQAIALEKRGFQIVLAKLDELAQLHSTLCIESTGTAHTFSELLLALRQGFRVFVIHIQAPLSTCIERVMSRDASVHIPVSDHRLREINERALQVELPWDLKIDNSEFQDETVIVESVKELLQR
ncbi:MAG: ATP-binding protein [Mojavia pulchra JT2-VF2]|jgi:shikimate kinase|uniref:ATP-binding protein n=1 Tax=Mojavia pulchra JT2-VF2 TaxID=287848 RepID=A0A951UF99_9NOST|nr:ATP-binding protein [Mojavia pulchra JT2-VF2]